MRTKIDCCRGCVPPKRTSDCHSYCPEYARERAELDATKKEILKKSLVSSGVQGQRYGGIMRVTRKRRA